MAQGLERTEEQALEFVQQIIPLLEVGMSIRQSCHYAAIDQKTVGRYSDKFESVAIKIKTAKMKLIANASNTVATHAKSDPKIALEALKRRSKETWGDNVDVTSDGQAINLIDFTKVKPDGSEPDTEAD